MHPQLFPPTQLPKPSTDDAAFSDDVFIIDENNNHGMAYYSFQNGKWYFYTDTNVDYITPRPASKWLWYYPTVTFPKSALVDEVTYNIVQKGTILIAHNPLIKENIPMLIVGKEYTVSTKVRSLPVNSLCLKSEMYEEHYFDFPHYEDLQKGAPSFLDYFTIKPYETT
ncbi:MAG: hypothetical protein V4538_01625 [Bacteroidota bacterium]